MISSKEMAEDNVEKVRKLNIECDERYERLLQMNKYLHHQPIELQVKKLVPEAQLPYKKHYWDAGWDLYSIEDKELPYGIPIKINTGISMAIPNGMVGIISDRSSMGSEGIKVMGGIIDAGYIGPIIVCLINLSYETRDSTDYTLKDCNYTYSAKKIRKNDRIAQIVLYKVPQITILEMPELTSTERGSGGFGSTGA